MVCGYEACTLKAKIPENQKNPNTVIVVENLRGDCFRSEFLSARSICQANGAPKAFRRGWVSINGLERLKEILCGVWRFQRRVGRYLPSADWKWHWQGWLKSYQTASRWTLELDKNLLPNALSGKQVYGLWFLLASIFRLGQQHLIQYVFVVCLLRRNLCESQVGLPFGSTGVDTKGPLRALVPHRWVLRKSRGLGGIALISGSKHLNARRMQIFEEVWHPSWQGLWKTILKIRLLGTLSCVKYTT